MNGFIAWLQIIFVDLVLAGDNAIVIAATANTLPIEQRKRVIAFGIFFAVLLRIGATFGMSQFLHYDWIMLAGGLTLFYIAWKMLNEL